MINLNSYFLIVSPFITASAVAEQKPSLSYSFIN